MDMQVFTDDQESEALAWLDVELVK